MTLELYPAVDILDGRFVRLLQGEFGKVTQYGDPLEVAERFFEQGARWLHVVDLNAAKDGSTKNRFIVEQLVRHLDMNIQVGGGIRDVATVELLLSKGASRVVLGTLAASDPELVKSLAERYRGRIAIALDYRYQVSDEEGSSREGRTREVAVNGWTSGSQRDLTELLMEYSDSDIAAVVLTDISRDGSLSGPDLAGLVEVLSLTDLPIIASGGVRGLEDLQALHELKGGGRRLAGVIVGRALAAGELQIEEALAVCAR
ncbi:MAG: 1-(5-phosphoribosyl)-5-[(5-phosphoribosylamino)methylideneamino] imidazole-4-carboxamide isomerase [Actinobacteria bacterium]|jgi:phosphoribosylformimino-5-aminoimidazole carboxamide ribotide isomerase|nr:1-(5-phosphoribosyl)-5-[(5-phosphoribosylamino)methylideneamino] imidazole-4-carboxamide isomerase [Actinomycetota bacterium]